MIVAKIILLLICTFSAVMSLVAAGITLDPDMDSSNLLPHVLAGFPLGLLLLIGVPVPTIAAYYLAGFPSSSASTSLRHSCTAPTDSALPPRRTDRQPCRPDTDRCKTTP